MILTIQKSTDLQVRQCRICGSKANRSHYGVFDGTMCKKCRLQSCIELGMTIDSLLIRKVLSNEDQFKEFSCLERAIKSLDTVFVNKINFLGKLAHKNNMRLEMGILKPSRNRMEISKMAEYNTLLLYLKDCGFYEMGLKEIDLTKIAKNSFYRWLFYSALLSTLRHGGHHCRIVHISDCGYLPLSFESCCEYLREHRIGDVDVLGKPYFELLDKGMKIAQRFHKAHLDRTEFSLLLQLMILKEAKELFPYIPQIGDQINELLRQGSDYHHQNYEDPAIRFGELIFLLYEINQIDIDHRHFSLLLSLARFDTVLPKISQTYGLDGNL